MRILVLNANTTAFVTETAAAEGRRVASPGTEIVPVTADFGAAIVATRTEHAIAEHAAVELAARHAAGCDAVVIAVSYDTGLKALREMLSIPVVGMTEAALLTACMLGGPIGLISFGARVAPIYRELIESYGLAGRIAGSRVLENTSAYKPGDYYGARCRTGRGRAGPDRQGRRREHHPARRRDGGRLAPHRGARAGAGARRHALRGPAGRSTGAHRCPQADDRQLRVAGRAQRVKSLRCADAVFQEKLNFTAAARNRHDKAVCWG